MNQNVRFGLYAALACVLGALLFEVLFPAPVVAQPQESAGSQAVVLTLDTSGSMDRGGKLVAMQDAAQNYLTRQNWQRTQVALVAFSSGANVLQPLSNNPDRLGNALRELVADGATEMDEGLEVAAQALGSSRASRRSILLFTDGEPDSGRRSKQEVRAATLQSAERLRATGVQIVAVATSDADRWFLGQLTGDANLVFEARNNNFDEAFVRADQAIKQIFETGNAPAVGGFLGLVRALALGGLVALFLGAALLMLENVFGLRGRWWRDLHWVPLAAAALGVGGTLLGQGLFALLPTSSVSRALGWALLGVAAGAALGLADKSRAKASRGALGGAVGGYIGGFLFGLLGQAFPGGGVVLRLLSFAVLGFAIGFMLRIAQDLLKRAWLTGITTGPYEGKQYILAKSAVTVGRSDGNDIGLYHERAMPLKLGVFASTAGQWRYSGAVIQVNGVDKTDVTLRPGDTVRLGETSFVFEDKNYNENGSENGNQNGNEEAATSSVKHAGVAKTQEAAPASPSMPAGARTWLLVGEGRHVLGGAGQTLRVGRNADNDVVLTDPSVSGQHASITIKDTHCVLVDMGSTNGTFCDGVAVPAHYALQVTSGQTLRFGTLDLRLVQP